MLNWSGSFNFLRYDNADNLKRKDNFQSETTFSLLPNGTNPNLSSKIFAHFCTPSFVWQIFYVPHIILNSNTYFCVRLLIPVILSYIAARYDHFRPFYRNLKMVIFSPKIHAFFVKIEIFRSWIDE